MRITGAARVGGIVGAPIAGSLSPLLHNTWLAAAGVDGVYAPFPVGEDGFERLIAGFRGGVVAGVNVTAPFKERALAAADSADEAAQAAGAANLLLFGPGGEVTARNTDGLGLLAALARQAPRLQLAGARVALLGAGGAARGGAATLLGAGAAEVRVVNRTFERARALADSFGAAVAPFPRGALQEVVGDADLIVNAISGPADQAQAWTAPASAVAMDMVYRPLRTAFLAQAADQGLTTVDGLEMLIGQARPTFEALFAVAPPEEVDVRARALAALGEAA